jgi:hypothetical protein
MTRTRNYAALAGVAASLALVLGGIAAWAGREPSREVVLVDRSGGEWTCLPAGRQGEHVVVHCQGQEDLDPTGQNGVRCYLLGQDGVECYNLRGGTKDLTSER